MNKKLADIDLHNLLNILKHEIFSELNCHALATVQSFDKERMTVRATMNYPRNVDGADVAYPVMADCPVVVLSGGPARLTFPIAKGDPCLIFFNDRDIKGWMATGQVRRLNTSRLHSFSDAIALVGLQPVTAGPINDAKFGAYDDARARLANGMTYVGVGPSKVKIANAATSAGAQLDTFFTAVRAFCTALAGATDPTVQTAAAALNTATTAVQTALTGAAAGLLE